MYRDTLLIIDDSPIDLAILNEVFKPLFRYSDAFRRSLQLLASDVGRSISQEMLFCVQDAQDLLYQELQIFR